MKSRSSCSLEFKRKTVRFSWTYGPATSKTPSSSCSRFGFTGSLRWRPPREMRARSTMLHGPRVAAFVMTHLQADGFGDRYAASNLDSSRVPKCAQAGRAVLLQLCYEGHVPRWL